MWNRKLSRHFLGENPYIITALAVGVAFICSLIALNGAKYHLAYGGVDDNAATYSHIYKWPEHFINDIISVYGIGSRLGTVINWGPALLWKYLNIPPEPVYIVEAYAQALMVGLSAFFFAKEVTQKTGVAFLSMLFTYGAGPWDWNLASYGDIFPAVYAAQIAFCVVLIAFVFILRGKKLQPLIVLAFTGLVHPSIALYGIAATGLFWVWEYLKGNKSTSWGIIALVLVVGVTITPSVLAMSQAEGGIPIATVIGSSQSNYHLNPFGYLFSVRAETFYKWILLVVLSTRVWQGTQQKTVQLWVSVLLVFLVFAALNWVGIRFGIPLLIRLAGMRTSQLLTIVSIPLVMAYLWYHLRNSDWVGILLSTLTLLMAVSSRLGLYWWLALCLFLLDLSQGQILLWQIHAFTLNVSSD